MVYDPGTSLYSGPGSHAVAEYLTHCASAMLLLPFQDPSFDGLSHLAVRDAFQSS